VGGVMGLSFVGLGVLSSLIPGALPEPDAFSGMLVAKGAMTLEVDDVGAEVVGESRMLNLALWSVVVRVEGADLRLSIDGAE
jgi:hypothetical protein